MRSKELFKQRRRGQRGVGGNRGVAGGRTTYKSRGCEQTAEGEITRVGESGSPEGPEMAGLRLRKLGRA